MIGPTDFGVTEATLGADLRQRWWVTIMGTRRNGTTYVHSIDASDPLPGQDVPARMIDAHVSFVSSRTPRTTAAVTAAPELGAQLVAELDTRYAVTLAFQVAYGDGPALDLGWVKGDANTYDDQGRLVLTGASDEQSILDVSELAVPWVPGRMRADQLLAALWDKAGVTLIDLANPEGLTGSTLDLEEVTDLWGAIHAVAESQGWRVYAPARDQGSGGPEFRRAPTVADPIAATLTTGPTGTITELEKVTSRAEFANEVVTVYEWRDQGDRDRRVIGRATDHRSADRAAGNVRRATHRFRTSSTQANANATALSLLRRATARAVSYQLAAINAFWLRPDMTVQLPDPTTGAQVKALVDQVTFTTDGAMHLVTRALPDLWTIGAALVAHPTIAAHRAAYPTIRAAAAGPTS